MLTTPMMQRDVTNPDEFVDAVYKHLEGKEKQFNYDQMVLTFLDFERFNKWVRRINRDTPVANRSVLVSGCGFGGSLLAWYGMGAAEVQGVEVDDEFAHMASIRVNALPNVEVTHLGPTDRLPFASSSFDFVECIDVIEHVLNPHAYLMELVRVLKPGGKLLLATPNSLWPVEQHLGIAGPPYLPVPIADKLFGLASKLPFLSEDRKFKYSKLEGMRTQNMTLVRLRSLAKAHRLHLELIMPEPTNPEFPIPPFADWQNRMLEHRLGRFLCPMPTIAVILHKPASHE